MWLCILYLYSNYHYFQKGFVKVIFLAWHIFFWVQGSSFAIMTCFIVDWILVIFFYHCMWLSMYTGYDLQTLSIYFPISTLHCLHDYNYILSLFALLLVIRFDPIDSKAYCLALFLSYLYTQSHICPHLHINFSLSTKKVIFSFLMAGNMFRSCWLFQLCLINWSQQNRHVDCLFFFFFFFLLPFNY